MMKPWLSAAFVLALIFSRVAMAAATYASEVGPAVSAAYPWEDTTGGTGVALNNDACSAAINLGGFTFNFGGTAYTTVAICSNGVLRLGAAAFTTAANTALPVAGQSGLMFPFWDDLNPQGLANTASQGIRYLAAGASPNRRFTVTYLRIPRVSGGGTAGFYTFQVTLFEDGRFVYRYGYTSSVNAPGRGAAQSSDQDAGVSATVGYQATTTDFIQYSLNTASVFNNDIILWRPTTQQKTTRADTTCGVPLQTALVFATTVNKASAETASNYTVVSTTGTAVTVNSASLAADNQTVTLSLTGAVANQIYIVRTNGVQTSGGQLVYDAESYTAGSAPATGVIGDYFAHGQAGADGDDIFPYFSAINGKSHVVQQDTTINFNVNANGFFPGGGVHDYSTRWLGYLVPTTTAKYCVSIAGDDGIRLFFDGSSVLNGWVLQSVTYYTTATPLTLNAGQYYQLQEEYYERSGQTVAALQWAQTAGNTCPVNPPAGSVVVPQVNLYSCKAGAAAFRISGAAVGINCTPTAITITAVDSLGNTFTGYTGTITLSTSTAHGTWSLKTGSGTFAAGAADSGAATYTFVAGDNGVVVLNLLDAHPESVNVNVLSGALVEDPSFDPNFIFQPTGLRLWANGVAGASIPNQVAGLGFSGGVFQLEAVGTDPSNNKCTSLLTNGTQSVNFALECQNPTSCSTGAGNASLASVNGTSIKGNNSGIPSSYTAMNLTFTNGFAPLTFSYGDAGQIAFYANTNVVTGGNTANLTWTSNPIVVRPFGFCIVPSSATNANPTATDATGTVFTTAGTSFNTTVKAVAWQAADDANNDGVPDAGADLCTTNAITPNFGRHITAPTVTLSSTLQQPSGGNSGSLTGNTTISTAFISPSNGQFQGTLTWSEVGIVTLNALTSNYLGSGMNITGARANVGRFIPHHFAISNSILTNRTDLSCSASTFTYFGEPLSLGFTLTAQNASNSTTQNYTGTGASAFAKLQSFAGLNTIGIFSGTLPHTGIPTNSVGLSGSWASGVWNVVASVNVFDRATALVTPTGPFNSTVFGAAPQDSDGVTTIGFNLDTDTTNSPPDGISDHVKIGVSTNLLYGRLRLNSASGPSDLSLPIPASTEYWNGSQFVLNTSDSCTTVNGASATLSNFRNYQGSINGTTPSGSATLSSGQSQTALLLSAPGAGNYGSVDVSLNLTATPWLEFDWNNDGTFDSSVTATASFGIYRGSDRVIYWQETQ